VNELKKRYAMVLTILLCICLVLTSCNNPLASIKDFFNKDKDTAENTNMIKDEQAPSLSEVSSTQPEDSRPTVMYYKDSEDLLVPVMRYVPKGELGIAKATISAMVYTHELAQDLRPTGLIPTLPMGTQINGAVIKENGLAIIDLSEHFLNFNTQKGEELGIKALVYALTEFPNITSVQIKVDGKLINKMPKGTVVESAYKRGDINLQAVENTGDKLSKVMVYYQKKGSGNYTYFVPVTKAVSGYKNSAEAALNALLQGPGSESGLVNPFPEQAKLLDVKVKDGVAYVNFSNEILGTESNKTSDREIVKAVTLTLKELKQISKVKFFINGKTVDTTTGLGTDEYINVPVFVNYYE